MSDRLLLDAENASALSFRMAEAATAIEVQRAPLAVELTDAGVLLDAHPFPHHIRLRAIAELTRHDADDLGRRWRIAIGGGPDFNAGMRALADITAEFTAVETRGGTDGPDGLLSRDDLVWAAAHGGTDEVRDAAAWLVAHGAFLAAVAGAPTRTRYLDTLRTGDFVTDDVAWVDLHTPLTLEAVAAFERQVDTWVTVGLFAAPIDIAADGGVVDGVLSESDFVAFLADADLPPEIQEILQRVVDDGASHDPGGIDWLAVLDVLSFVPVAGDAIDFGLLLYYLSRGDLANAFAHGVGLVPLPGVGGGAVRGLREFAEETTTRFAADGLQGVAAVTARETAQNVATGTIADGTVEAIDDAVDNPYLSALVGQYASRSTGG